MAFGSLARTGCPTRRLTAAVVLVDGPAIIKALKSSLNCNVENEEQSNCIVPAALAIVSKIFAGIK